MNSSFWNPRGYLVLFSDDLFLITCFDNPGTMEGVAADRASLLPLVLPLERGLPVSWHTTSFALTVRPQGWGVRTIIDSSLVSFSNPAAVVLTTGELHEQWSVLSGTAEHSRW
jgi:hypothetical protein